MRRLVILFLLAMPASAYSVLTHEAIVDSLWKDSIVPLLQKRFPDATADQLQEAHAYTYGGCSTIQDLGYYPLLEAISSATWCTTSAAPIFSRP